MSAIWSRETAKAEGLHKRDRAVLRELGCLANRDGILWWSQKKLAERMGMSERTIRTALANLTACGWIIRDDRRKENGARRSDLITLRTLQAAGEWAAANLNIDDIEREELAKAEKLASARRVQTAKIPARYGVPAGQKSKPVVVANNPTTVEKIHEELTMRLQGEMLEPPTGWPAGRSGASRIVGD